MVWSSGTYRRKANNDTVRELKQYYSNTCVVGAMNLSKSKSFGREVVSKRCLQPQSKTSGLNITKPKIPNTAIKKTKITSNNNNFDLHNSNNRQQQKSWFRSRNNDKTPSVRDLRPQTPNHKCEVGRSFADRMMRKVSPTKTRPKSGGGLLIKNHPTQHQQVSNQRQRQIPTGSITLTTRSSLLHPKFNQKTKYHNDDDNNENDGGRIGNTATITDPTSLPLHELNDRVARLEKQLKESERLRKQQGPPYKKKSEEQRGSKNRHSSKSKDKRKADESSDDVGFIIPTSTTSTPPTLFAHTKKLMEEEQQARNAWPKSFSSSEGETTPSPPKTKSTIIHKTRDNNYTQHDNTTNRNQPLPSAMKKCSPEKTTSSRNNITSTFSNNEKTRRVKSDDRLPSRHDNEFRDDSSAAPLPPTPKISNAVANTEQTMLQPRIQYQIQSQHSAQDHVTNRNTITSIVTGGNQNGSMTLNDVLSDLSTSTAADDSTTKDTLSTTIGQQLASESSTMPFSNAIQCLFSQNGGNSQ